MSSGVDNNTQSIHPCRRSSVVGMAMEWLDHREGPVMKVVACALKIFLILGLIVTIVGWPLLYTWYVESKPTDTNHKPEEPHGPSTINLNNIATPSLPLPPLPLSPPLPLPPPFVAEKPFCATRIGFSNRSNANCGPNSFAIACAHACYEQTQTILHNNRIQYENELASFEQDLRRTQQARNEIPPNIARLQQQLIELNASQSQHNQALENFRKLEQAHGLLNDPRRTRWTPAEQALLIPFFSQFEVPALRTWPDIERVWINSLSPRQREAKLIQYTESLQIFARNLDEAEAARDDARTTLQNNIQDLESTMRNLNEQCAVLERNLNERRQGLEQRLPNAEKVLQRARGEYPAACSEEEVRDLTTEAGGPIGDGNQPYRSQNDAEADRPNQFAKLRHLLYATDWRVIRRGGHGHWTALIRNPGEETVDLVNDALITPRWRTFDELFQTWSSPAEWNRSDIAFY